MTIEFDRDLEPKVLFVDGVCYPILRTSDSPLYNNKDYAERTFYYGERDPLTGNLQTVRRKICRHCGKIMDYRNRRKIYCSSKCRYRAQKERYNLYAEYMDDVPEYLVKYVGVVDDGERD